MVATKNVELGVLVSSLSWKFSERVEFGERGMGFLDQAGVSWKFQPNESNS